jgi:hypothetical protein
MVIGSCTDYKVQAIHTDHIQYISDGKKWPGSYFEENFVMA